MRTSLALILLLAFTTAAAAPKARLWEHWDDHDPASEASIDHSAWTAFLQKYVVPGDGRLRLNRVRYGAVSAADKKSLKAYIKHLETIHIGKYNRDEQRAYWINLYNAETVSLVIDHYPVDSIRDIGGGLFSRGPWDDELLKVDGVALTLNDIEHRILRPIWNDPLTHYGVNCASVGCPNLRRQAYTGANVTAMLRENARDYVNSPRGVRFNNGHLLASRIYDWFQSDFGATQTAVISHLRNYARPALSAKLDAASQISGYYYDWALNDAK